MVIGDFMSLVEYFDEAEPAKLLYSYQSGSSLRATSKVDDAKFDCQRPVGFMTGVCKTSHLSTRPLRCWRCDGCYEYHARGRIADLHKRINKTEHDLDAPGVLWTLGTNWIYTDEALEEIKRCYQLFMKRIRNKYGNFVMYLRVFEAGSKGGRLHVHFATDARNILDHKWARKTWIKISGVPDANVNFRRVKVCESCGKMTNWYRHFCEHEDCKQFAPTNDVPIKYGLMYLAKYLNKRFQVPPKFWLIKNDVDYRSAPLLPRQKSFTLGRKSDKIQRPLYVGKPLWYAWQVIEAQYSLFGDDGLNFEISVRPDNKFRRRTWGTFDTVFTNVKDVSTGLELYFGPRQYVKNPVKQKFSIDHEEYWRDNPVECARNDCNELLMIKSLEYFNNPLEELYRRFGKDQGDLIYSAYLGDETGSVLIPVIHVYVDEKYHHTAEAYRSWASRNCFSYRGNLFASCATGLPDTAFDISMAGISVPPGSIDISKRAIPCLHVL